jgi:cytochrome c-type biogenesis protein CcmH
MTMFVVIAAAMAAFALVWIVPALLRRRSDAGATSSASNILILKEQLQELERDVASGLLSAQQYQLAREDIERRALDESRSADAMTAPAQPSRERAAVAVVTLAVPLAAALLYLLVGNPGALAPGGSDARNAALSAQEVEAMVAKLAARLEQQPDDANGWALLARSYVAMQRFQEAVGAYERAAGLIKGDASVEGKALELVNQALALDPNQWKALAMAGTAAFERKDYRKAVEYWERLRQPAESNPELASRIEASIAEARQLGNLKGAPAKSIKPSTASVRGSVTLSPALAARAQPADTVFIFARAVDGPRLPLAIIRRQVRDLPFAFTLDDSQAMSPDARLSSFNNVTIGARISRSANAMPQSGDLQGTSAPVKLGAANVNVVIDTIVP